MSSPRPILAVAYSEATEDWNITVVWPDAGESARERSGKQDTFGPYQGFTQARRCADGIALRLTEDGHASPQIIVLSGQLWGRVTAF